MKNYYDILEVSENASPEIIEKAYKVLAKRYHPDLRGNSPETERKIREINEAYNVLSDNFLKNQYDNQLRNERLQQNSYNLDETYFGRMFREQEKEKIYSREEKAEENPENSKEQNTIGSYKGILDIIGSMFKFKPSALNLKKNGKINALALLLTIIVVVILGIILYILPFTHDWMNRNFIDTPLTHWLFK